MKYYKKNVEEIRREKNNCERGENEMRSYLIVEDYPKNLPRISPGS